MKAKEIMKKYSITRNTLSNWVKKGLIKIEKTPSGRYNYIIEEICQISIQNIWK
jgi:predicted site-specific integrase-resolvase